MSFRNPYDQIRNHLSIHDEFRCPVYVKDVVPIILALSKTWISVAKHRKSLLNVGGPDRLSRVQMAETVADIRGYNLSLIKSVSASSVDHGVVSPDDISMDISKPSTDAWYFSNFIWKWCQIVA